MTLRVKSLDELPERLRTDDVRRQLAGAAAPAPTGYQPAPRAVQQARESVPAVGASAGSPKPRKYRNEPTIVDGVRFDSKGEAQRYLTLRQLESAGRIRELRRQPEFALHSGSGKRVAAYIADFAYLDESGQLIVEDFKSPASAQQPIYRLKRALFEAEYGLAVREVYRVKRAQRGAV